MVYIKDAQTYIEQSALLLEARPNTTRLSMKYKISSPKGSQQELGSATASNPNTAPSPPRGTLTLKTYDPVSGTCFKYQTAKHAEVGRMIGGLGRCGRIMAGLPLKEKDIAKDSKEGETEEHADAIDANMEGRPREQKQVKESGPSNLAPGAGKKKKKGKR